MRCLPWPLPECLLDTSTMQVARREAAHPTADELAHRDEQGLYSASEPFWARVKSAALLTSPNSDRRVRLSCTAMRIFGCHRSWHCCHRRGAQDC